MFPEPESLALRERQLTDISADEHLAAKHQDAAQDAAAVTGLKAENVQAALRIGAALRAAYLDSIRAEPPAGPPDEWTWIVKAPPRPPLVLAGTDGLNSEELLANDSLGG